jgi:hypothetical protein
MFYHCPHKDLKTTDIANLCPECQWLIQAIQQNKATQEAIQFKEQLAEDMRSVWDDGRPAEKIDTRNVKMVDWDDDWPDELPLDYRMDI